MARYTGPKHKLARREKVNVLDKTSNSLSRRLNTPPGMHGGKRKRQLSEFGLQLREKQKAKAVYGLMEKQLRNLVNSIQKAGRTTKKHGETGEELIAALETRLDNIVYRLGFAKSRYQSRQFVGHGHILVDGRKNSIPSYRVRPDEVISLSQNMLKNSVMIKLLEEKQDVVSYLSKKGPVGKLIRPPKREDVQVPFDTQLIIEYYSR